MRQTHRFDYLLKHTLAALPLWSSAKRIAVDVADWLTDRVFDARAFEEIRRKIQFAEARVRQALTMLAAQIILVKAKVPARTEGEGSGYVPVPPAAKPGMRPAFRLFEHPLEVLEEAAPTEEEGEGNARSYSPPLSIHDKLIRRAEALQGVIDNPGHFAVRYKKRLMQREAIEAGEPPLDGRYCAKSEANVMFEHADRLMNDPDYWRSGEGPRVHAQFFDTS